MTSKISDFGKAILARHCPLCGRPFDIGRFICLESACVEQRREEEKIRARELEIEQKEKQSARVVKRLEDLFKTSGLRSTRFADFDRFIVDNMNKEAIQAAKEFADTIGTRDCKRQALVLLGYSGSGKSSLVSAIMNRIAQRAISPRYFSGRQASQFFPAWDATEESVKMRSLAEKRRMELEQSQLLILDDLTYVKNCGQSLVQRFSIFMNATIDAIYNDPRKGLVMTFEGGRYEFDSSPIFSMGQNSAISRMRNIARRPFSLGKRDWRKEGQGVDFRYPVLNEACREKQIQTEKEVCKMNKNLTSRKLSR